MSKISPSHTLSALQEKLLRKLADGAFHSGSALGIDLAVSRAAVCKAISGLSELGLEINAVKGRGYRLHQPLQLLQRDAILAHISDPNRQRLRALDVLQVVDSTNAYLMRTTDAPRACLAEYQNSGRGRRGRRWVSPYGSNIYLSMRWRFDEGMARLSGLSLAAGVVVLRALKKLGLMDVGLKWPNDIVYSGRKLGGILLEVTGESSGPCHVVLGLGLNMFIPPQIASAIDQPWIGLNELAPGIERNYLAAQLIEHFMAALAVFEKDGLQPFVTEWRAADVFAGEFVTLLLPGEQVRGVCRGIASDGELLLEIDGAIRSYSYGEVSLRRAEVYQ